MIPRTNTPGARYGSGYLYTYSWVDWYTASYRMLCWGKTTAPLPKTATRSMRTRLRPKRRVLPLLCRETKSTPAPVYHRLLCYTTSVGRSFIFILFGIVLSGFGLLLLRGSEDTWICTEGVWVMHGHPRAGKPTVPCPIKRTGMKLMSTAVSAAGELSETYTCHGANASPPFTIADVPPTAQSLALTLDDPDAVDGTFHHLIIWNIRPDTRSIAENEMPKDASVGNNSAGLAGYAAPCPPSGTHRYVFTLYALDNVLTLPEGATFSEFSTAIARHTMTKTTLTGSYTKH